MVSGALCAKIFKYTLITLFRIMLFAASVLCAILENMEFFKSFYEIAVYNNKK